MKKEKTSVEEGILEQWSIFIVGVLVGGLLTIFLQYLVNNVLLE